MDMEKRVHVHIIIPTRTVPLLLGKQGSNIKRLAHRSAVYLTIRPPESSPHVDDRVLVVTGGLKNIHNAIRDVISDIQSGTKCNMIDTEAEVLPGKSILQIPSSFATKLMASKAKELQEIAKQSGARFQLTPVEDMALGSTIRRLFITGSEISCRTAVARVLQKLHEFNQLPLDNRQEEMTLKMMVPQEAMQYLTKPTIQHIMMSQGVVIKHFPIDELKESIVTISGTLTKVFKAQTELMRVLDSYNILMVFTHTKKQLSPTNARRVEFERHLPNDGRHVEYERLPPSRWNTTPNPREVVREYNDEFRQPHPKQTRDFPNRSRSNDYRTPRDGRSGPDDRSFMGQKQPTHENVGEANQLKPHSTTEPLRAPNGGKVPRPSDPRRKVMSVSSSVGDSMSPRDDMRRSKPVDPRRQAQDISSLKSTDTRTSQLEAPTDGSVSQKPIDPRLRSQLTRDGPVEKPSDPRARPRPTSNTTENTINERATERTAPEPTMSATLSTPTKQQRDLQTSTVIPVDPRARMQSLLNPGSPAGKPVDPRVKPSLLPPSNATDSQTRKTPSSSPTGPANHGKLNRQSLTDSSDSSAPTAKPVDPRKRSIPLVALTNTSYQSDSHRPEVNGQTSRNTADKNTLMPQTFSPPPIPNSTQPADTSINCLDTNATVNANAPLMTKISLSKDNDQSQWSAKSLLNTRPPTSSGKNSNGLKTGYHEAPSHTIDEYDADPNDSPVVIFGAKPRARKPPPTIDLTIDSDSDTVSPQNLGNGRIKKEPNVFDLTHVQQVGDAAKSSSSVKNVGSMENQRGSHENHMNAMSTSQNGVTRPISSSIPLDVTDSPSSPIRQVSKNVNQPADPRGRPKTKEEGPENTVKQNLSSKNKQMDTKGQLLLPKQKQQQVEVKLTTKDTSSAVGDSNVDYQLKIKEFYTNHRPEKLHLLDTLLLTYKGREQELFNMLNTIESKSRQKISTSQSQIGTSPSTSSKLQLATASASLVSPTSTTTNAAPTHSIASDVPSSQKSHVLPPSSTNQTPIDYRAKVIAHYQQYSPEKLSSVDSILLKYKGKEEELLKSLTLVESAFSKKITLKSPVSLAQYDQPRKEARDAMPTLSVFPPSKSNPVNSKKSMLPTINQEQDASKTDYRAKVIEHYTKFSPERLKDIDSIMLKHKGKEEELLKTLKYVEVCHLAAPQIAAAAAAITRRSLGFAASNCVDTSTGLDTKVSATKSQTINILPDTEKSDIQSIPPKKKATGITSPILVNYHAKVIEHYKKYCPQKLHEVDAFMEEYKGNEKKLLFELKKLQSYHPGATPALSKSKKTSSLATEVSSINDEVDTTSDSVVLYANSPTEQTRSISTPSNSAVSNSYGGKIYTRERHPPTHATTAESCSKTTANINVFKAKDACGVELEASQAFGSTVYKAASAPHNNAMANSATTSASDESSEGREQVEKSPDRNESLTNNSDDVSPTVTRNFASHFLSRSKVVEPISQEGYAPAQPSSQSLEATTIIPSNDKPKDDQMESHSTHQMHSEFKVNKRQKSDSAGNHKPLLAKIEKSTPSIADAPSSLNTPVSDKPDIPKADEYHIREIYDPPLDKQPATNAFVDEAKESINVAPGVENRTLKSPIVEAPVVPQPRVSYSSDDDTHGSSGLSYQNQSFSHSDSSSHQIGTLVPMDWSSNTTNSDQTWSRYPARNSSYNLSPRDRKRQHEYDIREENKRRALAMRPGQMMLHEQQAEIETQVEIRVSGAIAQQVVGMGGLGLVEISRISNAVLRLESNPQDPNGIKIVVIGNLASVMVAQQEILLRSQPIRRL